MKWRFGILLPVVLACLLGVVGSLWRALRGPLPAGGARPPMVKRMVTDMAGRQVRLPARPERILSICTSASDTVAALGETSRLAAIDSYSRVVPGLEQTPVVGKGGALSKEQILARKIDLAFIWWYQDEAAALLAELDVPVVRLRAVRAAELPGLVRLVGDCLVCPEKAALVARRLEAFLAAPPPVLPAVTPPTVYLELYGAYRTVGRDSYLNDLLELAGGRNVIRQVSGGLTVSPELMVQADPEVMVTVAGFTDAAQLRARPGLAGVRAVAAGRVYAIERRWLVAGPALPEAVAMLRDVLAEPAVIPNK